MATLWSTRPSGAELVKRCRKRNNIYFNPPYSAGVNSRVGAQILKLVDTCFPTTNPLHKIFSILTIKVSYRTTPHMQEIITAHNKKLLNKNKQKQELPCTCRGKSCPVQGKYKQECTIYQAIVKHTSPETGQKITQKYIGLTGTTFYKRHQNQKTTFKLRSHETKSALSKYLWYRQGQRDSIQTILKDHRQVKKIQSNFKTCNLCTLERFYLICH